MQEKVNYDELMKILYNLNGDIAYETAKIKTDLATVSIKLNEIGFQSLATGTIDSAFQSVKSELTAYNEYIKELISWVNTNVIREYQSADESINRRFQEALNEVSNIDFHAAGQGYNYNNGSVEKVNADYSEQVMNYGR